MSKIIFTIIFGIIIGIIDVIPMIIKKLSRQSIVSAFLHYFLLMFSAFQIFSCLLLILY